MPSLNSKLVGGSPTIDERSLLFLSSAFMFRTGLALETFEAVRPFGILAADYFFFLSLVLFLFCRPRQLLKSTPSGILTASALVLFGGALSLLGNGFQLGGAAGPLARMFILFGLFAPLAAVHSRNIRQNMIFMAGGVLINCVIATLTAWVWPRIVDVLAINPETPTDIGQDIGRFAGLAGHSNILGLSAALAVLIGIGLFVSERNAFARLGLVFQILVCTVAALLSGSRTFFVSLIPGLIVLALVQKLHFKLIVRVLVALVVVWGGIHYLAPEEVSQYTGRLRSATSADDNENYGRLLTAGTAIVEISQKPIIGWGVDHFGEAGLTFVPWDNDIVPTHNSFLQYWYAAGLLGAIGFLALFAIPAKRMLQELKRSSSGDLANALRVGLGVYVLLFIASNLHPILFSRFLFVPLFMFGGLAPRTAGKIKAEKRARGASVHLATRDIPATS
jgi:O-antigen ligase